MRAGGILVALDPGIDGTGVAIFKKLRGESQLSPLVRAAGHLVELGLYKSDPAASIEARVCELVDQLRDDVDRLGNNGGGVGVVIEIARYTGSFRQRAGARELGGDLAKLHRTVGGLVAAAHVVADELHFHEPDTLPKGLKAVYRDVKAMRRDQVRAALRSAGVGRANVPGWGRNVDLANGDKIDAAWLGFRHLTLGRYDLLPPSATR